MIDQTIILKDGRTLGYSEYGNPQGKPVFFLHGWPSSRMHAENMAEAAKKLQVRLIAPDRPGIGLSDIKPERTLLDFPDDIVELADQLKLKIFKGKKADEVLYLAENIRRLNKIIHVELIGNKSTNIGLNYWYSVILEEVLFLDKFDKNRPFFIRLKKELILISTLLFIFIEIFLR